MSRSMFDRAAALAGALQAATKIDLTHPFVEGMPTWPTHPRFAHPVVSSFEAGAVSCNHAIGMSEHTGTHFDAPAHFIRHGLTIDRIPPDRFFSRMITIPARGTGPNGTVSAAAIRAFEGTHAPVEAGDAVFFHFGWDRLWYEDPPAFLENWPGLDADAADYLAARGVRAVGSDCLSIDPAPSTEFPAHRILLGSGILVGENFNNLGLVPPVATLAAMPLPFVEGSGSPLRAVALV